MKTKTLDDPSPAAAALVDHLYLTLVAGEPRPGTRWPLAGIDRVEVGRGAQLIARRDGTTLHVECPDSWMSSKHIRFERESGHWVVVDAGSRNGMLVDGEKHERAIMHRDHVVEVGRSFFMLREAELAHELVAPGDPLATLDPALAQRFDQLRRIAASNVPVLIGGPTGSGKERVARAIHAASGRSGAYIPVNCGALPAGLVESELFGHRRGAFSGAIADHVGLIAASDRGTLFLDEVGDLPAPAQAALLRVLEEHEVRAVGAAVGVPVDLRIVAATHRDLEDMVEHHAFREDLLARLAGFELELPALADRRVDLGLILSELAPPATRFTATAARALFAYRWPRNIRELVQTIERAIALAGNAELAPEHLPQAIATAAWPARSTSPDDGRREELVALLVKHRGNVSRIAAELGQARQQIQRWLKRHDLDPARYR